MLITAGPTREPIDDVRFIGNRSSGTLGIELAREAVNRGIRTTLALGSSVHEPNIREVGVTRFETTADLHQLLLCRVPDIDILVMAAAVADHTPAVRHPGKLGRNETGSITIDLVPTPDLLASVAASARPDQLLVGFALEPADRLAESAQRKLETKHVDLIVANPLDTMESSVIEATLFPSAALSHLVERSPGQRSKESFAAWLIPMLVQCLRHKANR